MDQAWLDEVRNQYRRYKRMAERAAAQVTGDAYFRELAPAHSLAVQFKHVGGNHRSRWRDALTTDGEKNDRDRDTEFLVDGMTREDVEAAWESGWSIALDQLDALTVDDLDTAITIRGQDLTVIQAILRNLTHTAYHTGQIVTISKHLCGDAWRTLSIAVGESEAHNERMRERHGDWRHRA